MTERVDIAIVTVLLEEYKAVLDEMPGHRLDRGEVAPNAYGWRIADVATEGGWRHRVVVALAGKPGNASGALAVANTIDRWRPRAVLLVGVAGGLPVDGLRLGDVVISSVIWAYEYGRAAAVFHPRHHFTFQADPLLVRAAMAYAATHDWAAGLDRAPDGRRDVVAHAGPVASGDKVVDEITDELFGQVRAAWPELKAVEMEGGGAAAAIEEARAQDTDVRFLMVRGISDLPGGGGTHGANARTRDQWKTFAAAAAARFTAGMIRHAWPVAGRVNAQAPTEEELGRALLAVLLEIDSVTIRRWVGAHPEAHSIGAAPAHRIVRRELAAWAARTLARPGLLDHAALDRLAALAPELDLSSLRRFLGDPSRRGG
jgi:nucleoside phosphorylase